nr:MAG TPA: hypothetical protein [Caudoviricetes sp.]
MSESTDAIDTRWEKVDYYKTIVEEIVCTFRNKGIIRSRNAARTVSSSSLR